MAKKQLSLSVKHTSGVTIDALIENIQRKTKDAVALHIASAVKDVVGIAAAHTPRWSGQATAGWRVTLNGSVQKSGNKGWNVLEMPPMKYEDGIHDSAARPLVARVKGQQNFLYTNVRRKLETNRTVRVKLYNTEDYADAWLNDESFDGLREVNQDFYTMEQIAAMSERLLRRKTSLKINFIGF